MMCPANIFPLASGWLHSSLSGSCFLDSPNSLQCKKPCVCCSLGREQLHRAPDSSLSSYPSFDLSLQCYFHKEALADLHSFFFLVDPCSFLSWPWLHSVIMCFVIAAPLSLASVCGFIFLVPWPGIEPMMRIMEVWNVNHWPAKEVPISALFKTLISFTRI